MSEFARQLGEPRSTVMRWLNGEAEPSADTLFRLLHAVGTGLAELAGEAGRGMDAELSAAAEEAAGEDGDPEFEDLARWLVLHLQVVRVGGRPLYADWRGGGFEAEPG